MVKKLLHRLTGQRTETPPEAQDSGYFTTQFLEREGDQRVVSWRERCEQLQAQPLPRARGETLVAQVWAGDRHAGSLGPAGLQGLTGYLDFFTVPSDCEVITQDEQGDYLLIVLEGTLAVDRVQPWGGRARLGEARAGDMLGEMSLLDAGTRFSACRTLGPCTLAVLEAPALDRMMRDDARLAAALLAALARRLSLRLRQVSARLGALLTQD